jgi:hypothetical protein
MRDANIAWWQKFRPINALVAELGDTPRHNNTRFRSQQKRTQR